MQPIKLKRENKSKYKISNLQILGQVLVLHGQVQGALQPLIPCIQDLPRQPHQRLLDVEILHWIEQIILSKPLTNQKAPSNLKTLEE